MAGAFFILTENFPQVTLTVVSLDDKRAGK